VPPESKSPRADAELGPTAGRDVFYSLGDMKLARGESDEAVKWYRKAAEQNFAKAQYNLGVCFYTGEGVAKDPVEAYKWQLLAARQGDEDAKNNITVLESELMTPEQIAEGEKRAGEFKPR
jgi:TPR repeat protein